MENQNLTENMQVHDENMSRCESIIKQEELKDNDDLLFAQLDTITDKLAANSSDYSLVHNVDIVSQLQQMTDMIPNNPFNKVSQASSTVSNPFGSINNRLPIHQETQNYLSLPFNVNDKMPKETSKIASDSSMQSIEGSSDSTTHFVKYKLQDGKHVKVWECGTLLEVLPVPDNINIQETTRETTITPKETNGSSRTPNSGSKEFTHQYTLMRHLPTHTDERKFQCNTCGKAFRQMSTLSQHRAIHSTERPFVCEICQKTFNRVSTLISHRKTHTGLKPHRCHMCIKSFHQKAFRQMSTLSQHRAIHSTERPFVCEICQKTFNRVSTLISHRKTHTGLKPHRCHMCIKSFHQKGNLRNHIFTHTNERPYKCDICDKGFNQMSNLMCHKMKAHQRAEKPKYVCQICGMCFLKRMGLRHHEQFTHGMVNPPATQTITSDKLNYMNAIFVDPIKTEAMRLAIESNQTPFALLRPITGIPVLVRVLPAGDKQMLVPASAEDLKKHSHISITMKGEQEKKTTVKVGSTVQIKIPVVATVIQQNDTAGQMSMSVVSPGPNGELALASDQSDMMNSKTNSFVYSSSLTNTDTNQDNVVDIEDIPLSSAFDASEIMNGVDIEFLDENGRRVSEKDFPSLATSSDIPHQDNAVTSSTSNNEILSSDGIDAFLSKDFPEHF